jgi:hypothetical protein
MVDPEQEAKVEPLIHKAVVVAEAKVPTDMVPSVVKLAFPAPLLVKAKVVLDPSTRSIVKVPAAVCERVVVAAAIFKALEAELKVKSPDPPEAIVRAPLSAMLLVVKVWDPMTVPVMKVPTPALDILVVPLKDRSPAVIARFPDVMVSPPEATVNPVRPVKLPPDVRLAVGVLMKLV